MLNRFAVGIAAGLASALLFAVSVKGTALAMALAYLAPLPIMIVAIGWGLDGGAVALAIAGVSVAIMVDPLSGLLFELTVAAPAGLIASLVGASPQRASLGVIALTAAGFGALISVGAMTAMILYFHGYDAALAAFREMLRPTLDEAVSEGFVLPDGFSPDEMGRLIIKYAPGAIAATTTLMLIANLYVAARTAQVSDRLPRPWLDLPTHFRLPAAAGLVAVAALAAWYFAPEPYSPFAAAATAPLALVFGLQGLTTLHALSRRAPGRPALLAALYVICYLAPRWMGPALAFLGLVESAISLRARAGALVSPRNSKIGP
jgi:hypothetical protein